MDRLGKEIDECFSEYTRLVKEYQRNNQPVPLQKDLYKMIGEKLGISVSRVELNIAAKRESNFKEIDKKLLTGDKDNV